jgi:hypothetical protein
MGDGLDWLGNCWPDSDPGGCEGNALGSDTQGTCANASDFCCLLTTECENKGYVCAADDQGACAGTWRHRGCPDDGYCCITN